MAGRSKTDDILRHLASRPGHDEVKADFRELLVEEFEAERTQLDFERRVPEVRGRIDALIGRTVFEAKKNLDREWADVERRMPDYLADRQREEGERFVGVASDGLKWVIFELSGYKLIKVKETTLDPERPEPFLAWLDGALALKSSLPPEALTIQAELGQDSVAFRRASESLVGLWSSLKDEPSVVLKRQLWASLLTLVYGHDVENDALWVQHTYLVIVAKAIATAVLDVRDDDPTRMPSGAAIQSATIFGAVESDFFDWPLAVPVGVELVRRIMAHVRRFRLREVQSDVMKVLYESLIDRVQRHGLGEYYTPDWLAAKIVREAVERPAEQRVLDPACGSGTFLFHAVRGFLAEAEDGGMDLTIRAGEATAHVQGMDIHPVAVIIARVTYLLALTPALARRTGSLSIPVYLGDALQLSIQQFMGGKELRIRVPGTPADQSQKGQPNVKAGETLDFPETFCRDPGLFDKAIERMRAGSLDGLTRPQIEAALRRIVKEHQQRDATTEEEKAIGDLGETYEVFDRLRKEGRDSVWAYVARNLSRPLALSSSGGWAHVIVGNPPWVAFRHMSDDLQRRFKDLAKGERVFVGGKLATHNDLAALFVVRSAALYLKAAGKLAMVMPMATLTRGQFEKFRSGSFDSTRLAFEEVWMMADDLWPLFPVPSCVIHARKRALSKRMPDKVRRFSGTLPFRDAPEEIADRHLTIDINASYPTEADFVGGSAYRSAFRQGATLVPRMLALVKRAAGSGVLGSDAATPHVTSQRSTLEKEPWKSLPGLNGRVEAEYLKQVLLGESILPYRIFASREAVVPVDGIGEILSSQLAANRGLSGLAGWMRDAEQIWDEYGAGKLTITARWNYHNELCAQFPISKLRVVYAKAGTLPAACVVRDSAAVIDHKLYWTPVQLEPEAHFLTAVLNSETARSRVEDLQSRGQWGARDFDKVIFSLPIPPFDENEELHVQLADVGTAAEALVAKVVVPENVKFQRARRLVREVLTEAGLSDQIDSLVAQVLDR